MANIALGFLCGCFASALLAPASRPASDIIGFVCVSTGMIIGLLCNRATPKQDSMSKDQVDPLE